ncbi:DUF433 domain-containing protein [Halalkaliarchaeum sp. AArc-CO]|uniref:DUF433 domain-containing protein n=1 Tax=Halalkaliarchaeum sp. AArc-CO TaxID=2866381 RepID=UPI00217D4F90|nr:DUF433 domain-containing protein [Halalkaliarchaeum sp. AArc-CO]
MARDEEIRSGSPRIGGTRITVLDVEYDVSMAELFTALSYDDDHREAFADREQEFATARQNGERRTRSLLADGSNATTTVLNSSLHGSSLRIAEHLRGVGTSQRHVFDAL